jgi:hypothetical protein
MVYKWVAIEDDRWSLRRPLQLQPHHHRQLIPPPHPCEYPLVLYDLRALDFAVCDLLALAPALPSAPGHPRPSGGIRLTPTIIDILEGQMQLCIAYTLNAQFVQ